MLDLSTFHPKLKGSKNISFIVSVMVVGVPAGKKVKFMNFYFVFAAISSFFHRLGL